MTIKALLVVLVMVPCLACLCAAQVMPQVLPLAIDGEHKTEAPFRPLFGRRLCDSSGSVYLRYFPAKGGGGVFSSPITKIDFTGKTKTIPIGKLPNLNGELSVFAVGTDKLFEVIRGQANDSPGITSYYAEFDQNGSLLSKSAFEFEGDFLPSVLVPLPSGDFFASGTQMRSDSEKRTVTNRSIAAIFGPDAKIKHIVMKVEPGPTNSDLQDEEVLNGDAFLAEDGRIYVFLASSPVKVTVLNQAGVIERKLKLTAPLSKSRPLAMFVSGGRIAINWSAESESTEPQGRVVVYDAQSGSPMRVFKSDFAGSPVCFQDGKTLTILTVMKAGFFGLATADLQ
jgi:hypothetical protein